MDADGFDCFAKTGCGSANRRRLLTGLLDASLAGPLGRCEVTAKGKWQHRRQQGVKVQVDTPKPNDKLSTKDT